MQGQLKTWQASQVGRVLLHLIWQSQTCSARAMAMEMEAQGGGTFRLRQLLQFMASRGSLETLRVGRRSMPI
jgi:hypothetical protein